MNPITIYMAMAWVNVRDITYSITGGEALWGDSLFGTLVSATVFILLMFAFVYYLHKNKIFIRI